MAALEQETEDVIPSLLHYVEPTPDAVSEIQLGWEEILPDSEGEIDKLLLAASRKRLGVRKPRVVIPQYLLQGIIPPILESGLNILYL